MALREPPGAVAADIALHQKAEYSRLHTRQPSHAFVVRIWWEQGLSRPDGRPLWRGYVQHAASGRAQVFQALDDLLCFIQDQTGDLEGTNAMDESSESNESKQE
jgi:hypothetical protein